MKSFHLKIVTPEGVYFDGDAESVTVPTITGYIGILAGHIDITTALSGGKTRIVTEGKTRHAVCGEGLISVHRGEVSLLPGAFSWDE